MHWLIVGTFEVIRIFKLYSLMINALQCIVYCYGKSVCLSDIRPSVTFVRFAKMVISTTVVFSSFVKLIPLV